MTTTTIAIKMLLLFCVKKKKKLSYRLSDLIKMAMIKTTTNMHLILHPVVMWLVVKEFQQVKGHMALLSMYNLAIYI